MSRKVKNAMLGMLLPALVFGSITLNDENGKEHTVHYQKPEPKQPRIRTAEEQAARKAHKQKLKARRNARKGIYTTKIVYKKGHK